MRRRAHLGFVGQAVALVVGLGMLAPGAPVAQADGEPPVAAGAAPPPVTYSSDQNPLGPALLDQAVAGTLVSHCSTSGLPSFPGLPHIVGLRSTSAAAPKQVSFAVALVQAGKLTTRGKGKAGVKRVRSVGKNAEQLKLVASALAVGGSPAGALAALLQASKQAPNDGALLVSASAMLTNLKRPDLALAFLDKAKTLHGKRPALLGWSPAGVEENNRGYALLRLGRYPAAVTALRKARAAAPELREASLNLGMALACEYKLPDAVIALRAGQSRKTYDEHVTNSVIGSSRPTADEVYDMRAGTDGVLPAINYPSTAEQSPSALAGFVADRSASSARTGALTDAAHALQAKLNALMPSLTPLRRGRILSVANFIGTATSEPALAKLLADMNAAKPPDLPTTFANNVRQYMSDCAGAGDSSAQAACFRDKCMPMTQDLQSQWRPAMNIYDTKVRVYWSALHSYSTGLIANVTEPTAHDYFLRLTDSMGEDLLANLLDTEQPWLSTLYFYQDGCINGNEPPPDETEEPPVATDPGECPSLLANGEQWKVETPVGEIGVKCDELELGASTEGLVGLFGKTVITDGSSTVVVGVRGGAGGADWESGLYIRSGPKGVEDVGWRTGPSVAVGHGVKLDAGLSQVDISLVGAVDYIPTALGF